MTRRHVGGVLGAMIGAMALHAAAAMAEPKPLPDKPFAEHRVVLQLSDSDAKKESLVISVANNLIKAYGPDAIAVEVVAFGPGIDVLRTGNANRTRVESLISQGVKFDVCLNTLDTIERETGKGRISFRVLSRCRSASARFCRWSRTALRWCGRESGWNQMKSSLRAKRSNPESDEARPGLLRCFCSSQ
jgi:intracellular sulfur oxidation DsrE/DsrF family protein